MEPIIKIEDLSKQYRLGTIGTGTISNDLKRWWHKVRGKEDPFLTIGETNDRSNPGNSEYVWALKNINLEIMPGEVLGIIGKNGAGKSTLLKILSKVTGPTTGKIHFNGRIGSLLEVGTGFHLELTGRENIFLNGAILGMTKQEIRSKLDEIIDFSGCERYIDTPVKRYSSGMKVRLGFAVAAHLEPEILVVDEVLSVGDAEFQKKAIGKMQDVSRNDGRTVLFVSHNMKSIQNLCSSCILLDQGEISLIGETENIINQYLTLNNSAVGRINLQNVKRERKDWGVEFILSGCKILNKKYDAVEDIKLGEKFIIESIFHSKVKMKDISIVIGINTYDELRIATVASEEANTYYELSEDQELIVRTEINTLILNKGSYTISIGARNKVKALDLVANACKLNVLEIKEKNSNILNNGLNGIVKTKATWEKIK